MPGFLKRGEDLEVQWIERVGDRQDRNGHIRGGPSLTSLRSGALDSLTPHDRTSPGESCAYLLRTGWDEAIPTPPHALPRTRTISPSATSMKNSISIQKPLNLLVRHQTSASDLLARTSTCTAGQRTLATGAGVGDSLELPGSRKIFSQN